MNKKLSIALLVATCLLGCRQKMRTDLDYDFNVEQTWQAEDLPQEIVQFESVFWEPDDTISLRKIIVEDQGASSRDVLEIGTGTGFLSLLCLMNGAKHVVATDINPAAVANAKYNAAMMDLEDGLEVRQVNANRSGAFTVIESKEKFDLIVSNPPWEDGQVEKAKDYAYIDPSFQLMDSILDGLPKHLRRGGRCLLAYGHVPAIERLQAEASERGYDFKILDDRKLNDLEKDFLPGMLVEIRIPYQTGQSNKDSSQTGGLDPSTDQIPND